MYEFVALENNAGFVNVYDVTFRTVIAAANQHTGGGASGNVYHCCKGSVHIVDVLVIIGFARLGIGKLSIKRPVGVTAEINNVCVFCKVLGKFLVLNSGADHRQTVLVAGGGCIAYLFIHKGVEEEEHRSVLIFFKACAEPLKLIVIYQTRGGRTVLVIDLMQEDHHTAIGKLHYVVKLVAVGEDVIKVAVVIDHVTCILHIPIPRESRVLGFVVARGGKDGHIGSGFVNFFDGIGMQNIFGFFIVVGEVAANADGDRALFVEHLCGIDKMVIGDRSCAIAYTLVGIGNCTEYVQFLLVEATGFGNGVGIRNLLTAANGNETGCALGDSGKD